jgi:hypothetical protein
MPLDFARLSIALKATLSVVEWVETLDSTLFGRRPRVSLTFG